MITLFKSVSLSRVFIRSTFGIKFDKPVFSSDRQMLYKRDSKESPEQIGILLVFSRIEEVACNIQTKYCTICNYKTKPIL